MTAPDKPGLSNEEFIEKWRTTAVFAIDKNQAIDSVLFGEALDRLEASIPAKVPAKKNPRYCRWCGIGFKKYLGAKGLCTKGDFHDWWDFTPAPEPSVATKERDFTPEEAGREAVNRYGPWGYAKWNSQWSPPFAVGRCCTEDSKEDFMWCSDSFRAAFASADKAQGGMK